MAGCPALRTLGFFLLEGCCVRYESCIALMAIGQPSRCSIVVSIPACHAGDPGSIPGNGAFFVVLSVFISSPLFFHLIISSTLKSQVVTEISMPVLVGPTL